MKMAQLTKISKNNTTITRENGGVQITLHNTKIVDWADGVVTLNTGGFATNTTRDRMNQASNELFNGIWKVSFAEGRRVVRFPDGSEIEFNGDVCRFDL
jgi:hypothetical protein